MILGLVAGAGFGFWRFVIPRQFRWHAFIAEAPRARWVSIEWTSVQLAVLPVGVSLLLIKLRREVVPVLLARRARRWSEIASRWCRTYGRGDD